VLSTILVRTLVLIGFLRAVGAFDGAREGDARRDVHLSEDVALVHLGTGV